MIEPVRAYLAVVIAVVAMTVLALGLLRVVRIFRPTSPLVRRDLLPRPWRQMTAWARCRSLRCWTPDPEVAVHLRGHLDGPSGRTLTSLGVSMARRPGEADVLVTLLGADASPNDREALCPPFTTLGLVDPSDADEFDNAIVSIAGRLGTVAPRVRAES